MHQRILELSTDLNRRPFHVLPIPQGQPGSFFCSGSDRYWVSNWPIVHPPATSGSDACSSLCCGCCLMLHKLRHHFHSSCVKWAVIYQIGSRTDQCRNDGRRCRSGNGTSHFQPRRRRYWSRYHHPAHSCFCGICSPCTSDLPLCCQVCDHTSKSVPRGSTRSVHQ